MKQPTRLPRAALLVTVAWLAVAHAAAAEIGDVVADQVFGESGFTDAVAGPIGPATLAWPQGIAIDRSVTPNRVYVSDTANNRVLGWSNVDALTNGAPADIVIGQPDFASFFCNQNPYAFGVPTTPSLSTLCNPHGLAVDGAGNLYVADTSNCRIVIFEDPFGTDQVADAVLGQATGCGNTVVPPVYAPSGVAVDGTGNVYVSGGDACGMLEYDQPLTTDTVADRVYALPYLVQPGLCSNWALALSVDPTGRLYVGTQTVLYEYDTPLTKTTWDHTVGTVICNDGGENASSTCMAIAAVADGGGHMYIADAGNSRVLEFDTASSWVQAARVFGQPGFLGRTDLFHDACNAGGASASSLCLLRVIPYVGGATFERGAALDLDSSGNLWVADTLNNRVLRYDNPLGSDAAADLVLGHGDMASIRKPLVAAPQPAVAVDDHTYNLLVVDTTNSRVLVQCQSCDRPTGVIGQPDFNSSGCNTGGVSASSLCTPASAMVDGPGNLWIADSGNHRILEYQTPWYTYDSVNKQIVIKHGADRVFGQADFTSNACGSGASGLCTPHAMTMDQQQQMYVSDSGNHRVLRYPNPLAATAADLAFGQSDLRGNACNAGGVTAASLCNPFGVYADGTGHLFVADHDNNRVLRYDLPYTAAAQVFGQTGSMTANACAGGAAGLCQPSDVNVDRGGNLLVADTNNNRVLVFDTPVTADTTADVVFGQPDINSTTCNSGGTSAHSLCQPVGVFTDVGLDELYIADAGNQRILRYDAPYCIGDFQLTPATRGIRGLHSHPVITQLRVTHGGTAGTDRFKLSGSMIVLENDGAPLCVQCPQQPVVTLSAGNDVLFRGDIVYLDTIRLGQTNRIYATNQQGLVDSGIDQFWMSENWLAPRNLPQYFRYGYRGEAVGLDLSSFTQSQARLRLQFGSMCFDTALQCRNTGTGRNCTPARQ